MTIPLAILLTLAWSRSPDPDVAGYWLYQGPQNGRYTNVVDLGNVASCMVAGMVAGATNFFAVRAYSQSRGGGELSREYRWPEEMLPPIVGATACDGVTLSWGSVSGAVYRVSCSTDISLRWFGWVDLTGDLVAAGNVMEWSEPVTELERFYRVVRLR